MLPFPELTISVKPHTAQQTITVSYVSKSTRNAAAVQKSSLLNKIKQNILSPNWLFVRCNGVRRTQVCAVEETVLSHLVWLQPTQDNTSNSTINEYCTQRESVTYLSINPHAECAFLLQESVKPSRISLWDAWETTASTTPSADCSPKTTWNAGWTSKKPH